MFSMKKCTIFLFVLISIHCESNGINRLRVCDPRTSWYTSQGTIEEATLAIRPKGIYTEFGLYLTFSSRGSRWNTSKDTLEVILDFELPKNAVVYDSWLYMKDYIAKAKILDKWSASSIYEGIVKRRKDPSILSKKSATQYELRIFPMVGNETRKVKITYLLPSVWNSESISSVLPIALLKTSKYPIPGLKVLTWPDSWFREPSFNNEQIKFFSKSDSLLGDYYNATIPYFLLNTNSKLNFNSLKETEFYFSNFNNGGETTYQLVFFPEAIIDSTERRKILVLVDFDVTKSNVSSSELLTKVEQELLDNLDETDYFNLMLSDLSINSFSNKWENANNGNIKLAFTNQNTSLSKYSNLSALIVSGIEFIKNNGNDGKVLLITNSDQYGDDDVANTFINDILNLMDPDIPIHIADYQSTDFSYNRINGRRYYGNEYFYSNISRITLGSLHRCRHGLTINETIDESFKYLSGAINSFDFYTKVTNGYCYSRYNLTGLNSIAYLNDPILQVGKYKGSLPFTIEVTGEYNNKTFSRKFELTEENAAISDSTIEKYWYGQNIKELENVEQSNSIIDAIIYKSINSRVLSKYTSFLCLENDDYICYDCLDESILTNIPDYSQSDSLKVYPNPFKDILNIEVSVSASEKVYDMSLTDMNGRIVYKFDTSSLTFGRNKFTCYPKGINGVELKPGFYVLNYLTNKEKRTIKLIKRL